MSVAYSPVIAWPKANVIRLLPSEAMTEVGPRIGAVGVMQASGAEEDPVQYTSIERL